MDARFSVASLFSAYTSLTAIFTLFEQFYKKFVPETLRNHIAQKLKQWFDKSSKDQESFTLIINEYDDESYRTLNFLYQACLLYLSDKLQSKTTRLQGSRENLNQKSVTYRLAQGETFVETLEKVGIDLQWKFLCKNVRGEEDDSGKTKSIHLSFDIAYKSEVLDGYLSSVVIKYHDDMIALKKDIFLYTSEGMGSWKPVKFNHPFTFDSLALDPELKQSIIDDLDMFIRRKEFYNRVGRAWKRGYLLYGPPGTGKSSLIAAMANHLRFNIYDLQLGAVDNDFTLRKLMLSTKYKSILVIEDIDCTMGLSRAAPKAFRECGDEHKRQGHQNSNEGNVTTSSRDTQLSLSGLLNFIDGLWSSCGDERIIVFTTNHKEQLDPALLRPGRMDMHIHMSYLTMKGFKILVNNYLGFPWEHPLFREIEPLLETLNVTPAQVAEELIRNEDPTVALFGVVDMLIKKRSMQIQNQEVSRVERDNNESQMQIQESSGQGKVNEMQMQCQENKESIEKKSRGKGKVKERQTKCQENKEGSEKRVSISLNGKKESSGVGFFKRMRKKVVNKKIHQ